MDMGIGMYKIRRTNPEQFRRYTETIYRFGVLHVLKKGFRRVWREIRFTFAEIKDRAEARRHREKSIEAILAPGVSRSTLGEAFRASFRQKFFFNSTQKSLFTEYIKNHTPQGGSLIIARADDICSHVFDLLGSGPTSFGDKINWHLDFKSNHHWNPACYYKRINPAAYPGGYDIKVPWELSRCQHFVWLGQAYWITGNERYGVEFVNQVLDWIESNPWPLGVNWSCTMDVAIRAVNWLWGLAYFLDFPGLTDEILIKILFSLWRHGQHIRKNLEIMPDLTTNHYLADLVGLTYIGILLPQYKEAASWQDFSLRELENEIVKQVYPDGASFEASISYHRLATELFISAAVLAQRNELSINPTYLERLEKMIEFTAVVTKLDGTIPIIGDNDNGRLYRLRVWDDPKREWIDHRHLLTPGALLFNRIDFAEAAGDQWDDAIWLFGEKAFEFRQFIGTNKTYCSMRKSHAFSKSGWYVIAEDDNYVIMDCGDNGQNGYGGHAHNDGLSFELYAQGRTWILDPGEYVYTADYQTRNLFRSTSYHNTVMVDHQEQNRFFPWQPFRMENDARVHVLKWEDTDTHTLIISEHDGYKRLPEPVGHSRLIFMDKKETVWIVRDALDKPAHHTCNTFLHFASDLKITPLQKAGSWILLTDASFKSLALTISTTAIDKINFEIGWVSLSYGTREEAPAINWDWNSEQEFALVTCNGDITEAVIARVQRAKDRLNERLLAGDKLWLS
jgi:hypothetical protein